MSQQNVDLVLAWLAAYNASDLDAAVALCLADVIAIPDASIYPDADRGIGRDELRRILEDSRSAWMSCAYTTKEALAVKDDRVLVRGDWGGQGSASGAEVSQELCAIYTIRDGQISRIEWFFDHDKALEAAGLREQAT